MSVRLQSAGIAATAAVTMLLILPARAPAQTPTGTLQGTVVDPSGGAVSGATITVVNTATNEKRGLTTDAAGRYVLPFVLPGVYTVTAEAKGFTTQTVENVRIEVSQNRSIDFKLQVGAVSQSVSVEAAATPLETNTATLGQVVGRHMVLDLPLNGRNPFALAELVPSVSTVGNASTPHIGGSRNAVNEEQLDGISNILPENNVGNTTAAYTPIVDSVEEFSVQTNSLAAEYGRFGGGVINVVTKSGTNEFHGSLFEFARNAALNANDFFANRAGHGIPSSYVNQYGGTAGGPVDVPGAYNGHDRTFFFFGFQGTNSVAAAIATDTVPLDAFRTGNFSGLGTTIYDPLAVQLNPATGQYVRQPFPGNIIPSDRFDPVAVKAMSYFPQPNTGPAGAQTNNFVAVGNQTSNDYKWDSRIDHNFTSNWHMFLRMSHDWNNFTPFEDYGTAASQGGNGPSNGGAWSASMDHTVTFSPTLVMDLRYGFSRSYVTRTAFDQGFNPTTGLGLPQSLTNLAQQRALVFPRFGFSTGAGLGNTGYVPLIENPSSHDVIANLTKVFNRHTIKFGGEYRKFFINFSQYGFPAGDFNFDQTWTQQILNAANGTGSAYASFLLGLASSGQITEEPTAADASDYMGWYIQDEWKVSSTLTVNLGLRWETEFPRTERYNRLSYWNPSLPSPLQGQVPADACLYCGNLRGQMLFAGSTGAYGRAQGPTQWLDLGPRVGIAWNPIKNTVIRTGFGIVYDPSALEASGTTGAQGMQGFTASTQMLPTANNQQTVLAYLQNPFPTGYFLPPGTSAGAATNIGQGIGESFFDSYRNPYSIQWNFNIQQALPGSMTIEVGYLGNRGLFLVNGDPGVPYSQVNPSYMALGNQLYQQVPNPFYGLINTPGSPLDQKTVSYNYLLRPYPQYNGVMSFRKPDADSMYNGLTVRLNKEFSNGLTLLASFTGAKLMDNSAAAVTYLGPTSGTYINQYNGRLEWAVSPQDVSRSLVMSFVYDLPFGRGKKFLGDAGRAVNMLVSGWQLNGILTFQDGTPIVLSGAINETGIFALNQTPDNTGHSAKLSNPTIGEWFNTGVFYQPPPFTFGNTSRTLPDVRNPGIEDADLSLFKNNYFGKDRRYNLQLRIEEFNSLNHPQWGAPNTNIQSGSAFGTITSLGVPARQIQLAAKFYF
jgi:hypothetical protein